MHEINPYKDDPHVRTTFNLIKKCSISQFTFRRSMNNTVVQDLCCLKIFFTLSYVYIIIFYII